MKNFSGKNALITGGSSGIGLALAKQLAGLRANIWILGRDPNKLEKASQEIRDSRSDSSQTVSTIQADVANQSNLAQALADFLNQVTAPDLLINSAGITYPGLFEQMELVHHRENMEINYFGTLHTIMAIIPGMIQRRTGHIVNISSLVGIHGLYGYSAYSPSKFAVRGLSDVLRYELSPYGIRVSVAFPSDTDTPQLEYENKIKPPVLKALVESNTKPYSAQFVANKIIQGIIKNKYLILPTTDSVLWYAAYSLLPGETIYHLVDILMNRARRKAMQNPTGK
jgi:3-dehydrosphinganine reductase